MQREIKFKFWLPIISKMTPPHTLEDIYKYDLGYDGFNMIPLQFSGLPDKNGTEMYEGDLVKVTGFANTRGFTGEYLILPLIWDIENARFDLEWPEEYRRYTFSDFGSSEFEVVGNIYMNPELLNS